MEVTKDNVQHTLAVLKMVFTQLCSIHTFVTGSEKRGQFAQSANFYHFSNCHHAKAFRALLFPLALQTLQAFYFTDPTLKATACLLS